MDLATEYALKLDPALLMTMIGFDAPDPWQAAAMRSRSDRIAMLCARGCGKSATCASIALWTALFNPGSLTLLLSPTLRQSGELFRKTTGYFRNLGKPIPAVQETATTLEIENGSRVISLPGEQSTVRGFHANLIIIDEAGQTEDALWIAINPMLGITKGRLIVIGTPMGKRGWFHDLWTGGSESWERIAVPATQCPRINPEFLKEQRELLGERYFNQEYMLSFEETVDQVFPTYAVMRAFELDECDKDLRPLFIGA